MSEQSKYESWAVLDLCRTDTIGAKAELGRRASLLDAVRAELERWTHKANTMQTAMHESAEAATAYGELLLTSSDALLSVAEAACGVADAEGTTDQMRDAVEELIATVRGEGS